MWIFWTYDWELYGVYHKKILENKYQRINIKLKNE